MEKVPDYCLIISSMSHMMITPWFSFVNTSHKLGTTRSISTIVGTLLSLLRWLTPVNLVWLTGLGISPVVSLQLLDVTLTKLTPTLFYCLHCHFDFRYLYYYSYPIALPSPSHHNPVSWHPTQPTLHSFLVPIPVIMLLSSFSHHYYQNLGDLPYSAISHWQRATANIRWNQRSQPIVWRFIIYLLSFLLNTPRIPLRTTKVLICMHIA